MKIWNKDGELQISSNPPTSVSSHIECTNIIIESHYNSRCNHFHTHTMSTMYLTINPLTTNQIPEKPKMSKVIVVALLSCFGVAVNLVKGQFNPGVCIPYPNYQSSFGRSFWVSWRGNKELKF